MKNIRPAQLCTTLMAHGPTTFCNAGVSALQGVADNRVIETTSSN